MCETKAEEGYKTSRVLIIFLVAVSIAVGSEPAKDRMQLPYVPGQIIVKFRKPVADNLQNQMKPDISSSEFKLTKQLDKLNRK